MATEFKVDTDVPIRRTATRSTRYPWAEMEHGHSVLLPVGDSTKEKARRKYANSARSWLERNRPGWKITTAQEGEENIRIWFLDESKIKE